MKSTNAAGAHTHPPTRPKLEGPCYSMAAAASPPALDQEGQATTNGERSSAQVALRNTRPKEARGKRLCVRHAGDRMGGTPRGSSSACEHRDGCPTHLLKPLSPRRLGTSDVNSLVLKSQTSEYIRKCQPPDVPGVCGNPPSLRDTQVGSVARLVNPMPLLPDLRGRRDPSPPALTRSSDLHLFAIRRRPKSYNTPSPSIAMFISVAWCC